MNNAGCRMRYGFIILLLLSACQTTDYSVDQMKNEYGNLFEYEVTVDDGGVRYRTNIRETDKKHFLHDMINEHESTYSYYLCHLSKYDVDSLIAYKDDPGQLNRLLIKEYGRDTAFNNIMLSHCYYYLREKGDNLLDFTPPKKPTYSLTDVKVVAVRFIFPTRNADGELVTSYCIFNNGLSDIKGERDFMLEAFCFEIIMGNLNRINKGVTNNYKTIGNLGMSTDSTVHLSRIQGAVWYSMMESNLLDILIGKKYEELKSILPFEITY